MCQIKSCANVCRSRKGQSKEAAKTRAEECRPRELRRPTQGSGGRSCSGSGNGNGTWLPYCCLRELLLLQLLLFELLDARLERIQLARQLTVFVGAAGQLQLEAESNGSGAPQRRAGSQRRVATEATTAAADACRAAVFVQTPRGTSSGGGRAGQRSGREQRRRGRGDALALHGPALRQGPLWLCAHRHRSHRRSWRDELAGAGPADYRA